MPIAKPFHARRVLLVDDAIDEREMYAESLRRQGFYPLQAENAADAFRLAAELTPDVVVTDVRLRGHADGLALTRRLKGAAETAALPVVVLSGSTSDVDSRAAVTAGCDLFLSKPCLPDELARALAGVLVSSKQLRAAGDPARVHGAS